MLTTAGTQVPEIPSIEVDGNTGATAPEQKEEGIVNVGVVETAQLLQVLVIGATQGNPLMETIVKVTL